MMMMIRMRMTKYDNVPLDEIDFPGTWDSLCVGLIPNHDASLTFHSTQSGNICNLMMDRESK